MNNSALVQATAEGHGETADILLKAGADPNFVDVKNNGSTPLLLACKFNHVAIAKVFAHGGHFTSPVSNQLVCDVCGVVFLHCVQSLLNAKGDPNIAEKAYGLTPLMAAASIGSVELVRLLCDAGAAVDAQVRPLLLRRCNCCRYPQATQRSHYGGGAAVATTTEQAQVHCTHDSLPGEQHCRGEDSAGVLRGLGKAGRPWSHGHHAGMLRG